MATLETLKNQDYLIVRDYLPSMVQNLLLDDIKKYVDRDMRQAPVWLGNFKFIYWKGECPGPAASTRIENLFVNAGQLVPEQKFNTLFIQKYEVGSQVKRHRDPKNNLQSTIIIPLGDYEGAEMHMELGLTRGSVKIAQPKPGDALILRCTMEGIQGPPHMVTPVTKGTKYSFIMNTII